MARTRFWVDVKNSSGTRYGVGPITSVTSWTSTRELDRAGRFSFDMSAEDPRALYCQSKRYVHCYRCDDDGQPELIGSGIIDSVKKKAGNPMMLTVSGGCVARELSYRSVHDLSIENFAKETPDKIFNYQPVDVGTDVWTDLTNAYDDNAGTEASVTWHTAAKDPCMVYIGRSVDFEAIEITMGSSTNTVHPCRLRAEFWNGDTEAWEELNITEDGTKVTVSEVDYSMRQSGTITFTPPPLWGTKTVNSVADLYWVRLYMEPTGDHSWPWQEVDVKTRYPTSTGLADIMSYAPSGWTLDTVTGHSATLDTEVLLYFGGESVLEALVRLSEKTGEHFRIDSGRKVVWLQNDNPTAGCYLIGFPAADGMPLADNPYAGMIVSIEEELDTYEIVSRIYPRGGGYGDTRPDLADCTRTPPAGYTLNTTDNYIRRDATESTYGQIEDEHSFAEITALSTTDKQRENAANQLFDIALTYLQKHSDAEKFYRIRAVKLPELIQPGEMLNITYHFNPQASDSSPVFNIRDDFYVIEVTDTFGNEGLLYTDMMVSTIDRAPTDDAEQIAQDIIQGRTARVTPTPDSASREVDWRYREISGGIAQSIGNADRLQGYKLSPQEPSSYEGMVWDATNSVWRGIDLGLSAPGTYMWGNAAARSLIMGAGDDALALHDDIHRVIFRLAQDGEEYVRFGLPFDVGIYWDVANHRPIVDGEALRQHSVSYDKMMLASGPYNYLAYSELRQQIDAYQYCEMTGRGVTISGIGNQPPVDANEILSYVPGILFRSVSYLDGQYIQGDQNLTKIGFDGGGPTIWRYDRAMLQLGRLTDLLTWAWYAEDGFYLSPRPSYGDSFSTGVAGNGDDFTTFMNFAGSAVDRFSIEITDAGLMMEHGDRADPFIPQPSLTVNKSGVIVRNYLAWHETSIQPPAPRAGAIWYDAANDRHLVYTAAGEWEKLSREAL